MRIMSFNIRCTNVGKDSWEDRIGIVSQTMLDSEADSIGVQEATPEWMATLKETVGEKYSFVGVGRDDGANEGEYSAIFYLKDIKLLKVIHSGYQKHLISLPSVGMLLADVFAPGQSLKTYRQVSSTFI